MADHVQLADGTDAWIWPLLRTDRDRLARDFEALSPESRRRRFLSPVVHLSETMLDHLVDDVDGVDHVALVLSADTGDVYDPVGIARMVRYADQADAADLAVTVRDEWQGRGVATALLPVLMRVRPEGITRIVTEVAADNPASIRMLERLGPVTERLVGIGTYTVTVDVSGWPRDPVAALTHEELLVGAGTAPVDVAIADPGVGEREILARGDRGSFRTRDQVCPWFR